MKLFEARNVFETNKFCYFYSKLINFVFVTISKESEGEKYKSQTTKWDILRFIIGFPFFIYIFYDTLLTKFQQEKRSLIFEIILSLNGKLQTINGSIVILHVFIYRNEYFKIFESLHTIDCQVRVNFRYF